jgi:hypothetical protein
MCTSFDGIHNLFYIFGIIEYRMDIKGGICDAKNQDYLYHGTGDGPGGSA